MPIDAYAHVGSPRFGTAAQAAGFLLRNGIGKMVLVLGPAVPDLDAINEAHALAGDRVRVLGIPFGATAEQRRELVDLQLSAGVLGLRMEPREIVSFPDLLDVLGAAGRWVYATNPVSSAEACGALLDFLGKYPAAKVGAPHFLVPGHRMPKVLENPHLAQLLAHPRFFPILSRHGGMGSVDSYPHADFLPWVEHVLELCGPQRMMFGSEYPVLLWRDELYEECLSWMPTLFPETGPDERDAFFSGNAERLLFSDPPPPRRRIQAPAWLEDQFDRRRTVPLFRPSGFDLPMDIYRPYLDSYLERDANAAPSSAGARERFSQVFVEGLSRGLPLPDAAVPGVPE